MRSRKHSRISSTQVHQWALQRLQDGRLLKDHGPLCTAAMVWNVVLRAAARMISICAACRDLAHAPCAQAVFDALTDGVPRTLGVLEKRLNSTLIDAWPSRLKRRRWPVAIDWHLVPYYGQPQRSRNELYYGKPRQGTTKFHAYATASIVQYGHRYTLALSWVRRHESTVQVLQRLLARLAELGVQIRYMLLDRAFFNVPVVQYLQGERIPFLMPVMFRGRPPKKKRATTGLHWIKRQKAGWYAHTLKNRTGTATIRVCVAYRTHRHRKDRKRVQQKLLFGAWRVHGSPTAIRERYRKRFGIESAFRQLRQARIYTCTRNPHLRLLFVAVALIVRNLWVCIHESLLADRDHEPLQLHLERLRFKRFLDWISQAVVALLHDGSIPCVVFT